MKRNLQSLQVLSCMYGGHIYSGLVQYYMGFESEEEAIEFLNSFNGELRKLNSYHHHHKAIYKIDKESKVNCNICPEEGCIERING